MSNWKTFTTTGINSGLTVKYPPNWVTPEDTFISEKTFVPGEQDKSKVYNIIGIQKYDTQLYVGYTNSEWFNKINNLSEPMSDQRDTRTKIASGKITSGESYVIFKNEPSATAKTEIFKQVKAYILKDQTIYQLTLDLYDNNGLETFKKIVSTANIQPSSDEASDWKTYATNEFYFKYPNSWFIDPENVKEGEYINFFLEGTTPDPTKSMHKFGNEVFRVLVYGDESVFNGLKSAVPAPKEIKIYGMPALRSDNQVDILMMIKVLHLEFRGGSKSYMDQILSNIRINR